MKRPPIVVVMGHVDHGKTALLDYIRKTNIVAKETGGITQSIGAYEIEHSGEKITFIDTPGHEAFSKMRARGTDVADIALLVVAADEGVKPQTKEAYQIIKESKTPFIVVVNKIDKSNADVNRVKNELAQEGILLEGAGGDISWKEISAKTGQGIDDLLDLIALTAEIEELSYNPEELTKGFILESHRDSQRGIVASAIVQDGTLKIGDEVVSGPTKAKIKLLEDWQGKRIERAEPSMPVLILGFAEVPEVGNEFFAGNEVKITQPASQQGGKKSTVEKIVVNEEETVINLILKAGDSGSLEVLADIIKALPMPDDYRFKIINQSVGDVTDGAVKLAISTKSIIIGFKVKADRAADNLAREHRIKIRTSDIVYELVKDLEEWLDKFKQATVLGDLEVLAFFSKKGTKQVIGGKVIDGTIVNNTVCQIQRGGKDLGSGKIISLQKNKQDVNKVESGNECGLLVNADVEIKAGDHIMIYENLS